MISPRFRFFPALALACASCGGAIRSPHESVSAIRDASSAPPAREPRISEVLFHRGVLWMRGARGTLGALDLTRGVVSYPLGSERVVDIHRTLEDRLWVLSQTADDVHLWEREQGGFKPILAMAAPSSPMLAVADVEGRPVLLAERAVFFEDEGGSMQAASLGHEVKPGRVRHVAFAVAADGSAYAGMNSGEWGGALYRITLATGEVAPVSRIDGPGLCTGPFNPACDPITSLIRDPGAPACVIAGVGLRHFMDSGRLLRVCGGRVSVVDLQVVNPPSPEPAVIEKPPEIKKPPARVKPSYDEGEPPLDDPAPGDGEALGDICSIDPSACPSIKPQLPPPSTAIFGLSATRRGYWIMTGDALLFAHGDRALHITPPRLVDRGGVRVGWTPGALLAVTDANWAASVSGYTPLVAATSLEGPLGANDLALYPALVALSGPSVNADQRPHDAPQERGVKEDRHR